MSFLLGIVDGRDNASKENCARLPVPDTLGSTMWEMTKFADAVIQRATEGDIGAVVNVLAHVKGTRHLGGLLVRAAMQDEQWSQHLHLVQKVRICRCG